MKTTLNKIRAQSPCKDGWEKLLKHLGKTRADDEPLALLTILDSNGLDDALWCLRAVNGQDKEIRLYAVWCARQVQHLMKDPRSLAALDVAERFANGEATEKELAKAWYAARAVVDAVYEVVIDADWPSASAAASAAMRDAAIAAEDAAASAAKSTATSAVERNAERNAARDSQEARLREVCNEVQGEDK